MLGYRAALGVPLMRGDVPLGALAIVKPDAGTFTDSYVALLKTFADQAVIAIENVRLFNETKEALERQTATAEILKVISSSPTDERPVFDAIVASAERLFTGRWATVWILDGGNLVRRAGGASRDDRDEKARFKVLPADQDSLVGKAVLDGSVMEVTDTHGADATVFARRNLGTLSYRAMCAAPLLREGKGIGVISVSSAEPGAMPEKQ
jgi:transcriptional regulator with GAF, ATPase, and Fis domain